MNTKERIIELVKNNVLSMEEALQLLEAANKQVNQIKGETDYVNEYQEAQAAIEAQLNETQGINKNTADEKQNTQNTEQIEMEFEEKFETLSQLLEKKQEALTIAKQRLRELEIFAELDELTPEMIVQKEELTTKITQLENDIEELHIEIDVTRQELRQNVQEEFKRVVEDTTDKVAKATKEFTKQFTKEASKEGRNIQASLKKGWKEFTASFDMKDINLSVPWIKSTPFDHQFEYEVSELNQIDMSLLNGSLTVEAHEQSTILIDANITFYGNEAHASLESFENLTTIDSDQGRFIFHVNSPRIAADLKVKIPRDFIHEVRLTAVNGDLEVKGIEANDLYVDSKNGEVKLSETTAKFVEFEGFNGDVFIDNSQINDLVYHVLNGDLKYRGNVGNISADVINGDLLITKKDAVAANMNIKTVSGDIKISVPNSVNLEFEAASSHGEVKQRLSSIDVVSHGRRFERYLNEQMPLIKVEAKTTSGDIYLKD